MYNATKAAVGGSLLPCTGVHSYPGRRTQHQRSFLIAHLAGLAVPGDPGDVGRFDLAFYGQTGS